METAALFPILLYPTAIAGSQIAWHNKVGHYALGAFLPKLSDLERDH